MEKTTFHPISHAKHPAHATLSDASLPSTAVTATESSSARWPGSPLALVLNLLATVQLVWFYLSWVHPYLNAVLYEQGLERTPYQQRMLMIWPMRWAHSSTALNILANKLNPLSHWFEFGVRPEGILQAVINVASILITGLVTVALYNASSRTRLLRPFIYPLMLVMVLVTYCIGTAHHIRMLYDLPGLAFFAVGLSLIYFRRNLLLFGALFLVATINRETTLFLLFFLVLRTYDGPEGRSFKRLLNPAFLATLVVLSAFWLGWHHWVGTLFAHNPTETVTRWRHNLVLLVNPLTWPQFFSMGAFTVPLILVYREKIGDSFLRLSLWILAPWMVFMMMYGHVIETRIFGELIPYFTCCVALIAENFLLRRAFDSRPDAQA